MPVPRFVTTCLPMAATSHAASVVRSQQGCGLRGREQTTRPLAFAPLPAVPGGLRRGWRVMAR